MYEDDYKSLTLKDWERTDPYRRAIAAAQDAYRLYSAECQQTRRKPLTWDTAEIVVGAVIRELASSGVLPELPEKP